MPASQATHTQTAVPWSKRRSPQVDDAHKPVKDAMAPMSATATSSLTNMTNNSSPVATAAKEPKVRVGELYWKQDGAYGWTLGQVVALQGDDAQTAKWIAIDETSGEARDVCDFPPQMLALDECPLYPANPLFTYVLSLCTCIYGA